MRNDLPPKPGFTDMSIMAQLIMLGLIARYGDCDPEGLTWARQALQTELKEKGWILPPFRVEGETE